MLPEMLYVLLALPSALGIHEAAHAYVAVESGDGGPAREGRVTLNPLAHLDFFGTVLLPAVTVLLSQGLFIAGYAKPVIIEPQRFRKFRVGIALCAAAGPLANLVSGVVAVVLARLLSDLPVLPEALLTFAMLSLFLAVLNMLPIPPLDGSRVVQLILPEPLAARCIESTPVPLLAALAVVTVVRLVLGFDAGMWVCDSVVFPLLRLIMSF